MSVMKQGENRGIVTITAEALTELLHRILLDQWPEDAQVECGWFDLTTNTLHFRVSSGAFPRKREGETVPTVAVIRRADVQ